MKRQKNRHKSRFKDSVLFVKLVLKSGLVLASVGTTVWQSYQDKNGQLALPKIRQDELKDRTETPLVPIVAICPKPIPKTSEPGTDAGCFQSLYSEYNCSALENCGIHEYNYKYSGQYASEQCPNPQELQSSIFKEPSDLISNSENMKFDSISVHGLANCLHVELNSDIKGLYLKYHAHIYAYRKGNFLETYGRQQYVDLPGGSSYEYTMDYEVVSESDKKCNPDLEYSKDECIWNEITNETLLLYECTTPFGPDKSQICGNANKGQAALKMLENLLKEKTKCLDPCMTLRPKFSLVQKTALKDNPGLTITVPRTVLVKSFVSEKINLPMTVNIGTNFGFCGFCLICMDKIVDLILNFFGSKQMI